MKMTVEWTSRYTWRPWSSEFRDAVGRRNWANSVMHLEAVNEQGWRCTWRPWSSEYGDAHGGCNRASLEMHLYAKIRWLRDALGGCDRVSLEIHLEDEIKMNSDMHVEAVIERVCRCIWRLGTCDSEIHLDAMIGGVWRCIWRPQSCDSEMHLNALIERVCRSTWGPWSSKIGDVLGGGRYEERRLLRLYPSVC